MAFVRPKEVNGYTYYQLVKSERVDGKHRQRMLMHLGRHRSVEAALEAWEKRARIERALGNTLGRLGAGNPHLAMRSAEAWEEKAARLRSLCGD
jgi:hypothetical protein